MSRDNIRNNLISQVKVLKAERRVFSFLGFALTLYGFWHAGTMNGGWWTGVILLGAILCWAAAYYADLQIDRVRYKILRLNYL